MDFQHLKFVIKRTESHHRHAKSRNKAVVSKNIITKLEFFLYRKYLLWISYI